VPGAAAATGPEQAAIDLTGGRRDQGEGTAGTVGAGSRGRKRQRATEGRGRRRVSAGDKPAGKKSRAGGSRGGAAGLARTRGQDGRAGRVEDLFRVGGRLRNCSSDPSEARPRALARGDF
jgi:hypothetical protein